MSAKSASPTGRPAFRIPRCRRRLAWYAACRSWRGFETVTATELPRLSHCAASHQAVIPRASGVSSTPHALDPIAGASEYWIARFRRRWECGAFVLNEFLRFSFQTAAPVRKHSFAISPRLFRARFAWMSLPLNTEGAGNAGRSMRPQPRVQNEKHTSIVTTVTPETPGIPRAMVLTVCFALLCLRNLPECANGRFSPTARRWI